MEFVNLTPHTIDIMDVAGNPIANIAPSGTVARANMIRKQVGSFDGIPTFLTMYGEPTGIPEPAADTIYIVSGMMVQAVPDRTDVWAPGDLLRNAEGQVVGCVGLSRPAAKRGIPAMIGLDFDGVVANYGDHVNETRFNPALRDILPRQRQPVAIVTNQGGTAFHRLNPERYPSPEHVAQRLAGGIRYLSALGYPVAVLLISVYHPKAERQAIQYAAHRLRLAMPGVRTWHVYTTAESQKPSPFMLQRAHASVYYGDSPEDAQAAAAAGIPFVAVPRFM